jgi:hypothetical protein
MSRLLTRLRAHLRFANVMSALALFLALGGTSYAAVSIGSAEIRTNAVGKSEIRSSAVGKSEISTNAVGKSELAANGVGAAEILKDAVGTSELRDGSIDVADLSPATRTALTTTDRTMVTTAGTAAGGNAKGVTHTAASGTYTVEFTHDVSACTYSATFASVKNGTGVDDPPAEARRITVAPGATNTTVVVKVDDATGATPTPKDAPFHLVVTC